MQKHWQAVRAAQPWQQQPAECGGHGPWLLRPQRLSRSLRKHSHPPEVKTKTQPQRPVHGFKSWITQSGITCLLLSSSQGQLPNCKHKPQHWQPLLTPGNTIMSYKHAALHLGPGPLKFLEYFYLSSPPHCFSFMAFLPPKTIKTKDSKAPKGQGACLWCSPVSSSII